jgi:hypothetical protein
VPSEKADDSVAEQYPRGFFCVGTSVQWWGTGYGRVSWWGVLYTTDIPKWNKDELWQSAQQVLSCI